MAVLHKISSLSIAQVFANYAADALIRFARSFANELTLLENYRHVRSAYTRLCARYGRPCKFYRTISINYYYADRISPLVRNHIQIYSSALQYIRFVK